MASDSVYHHLTPQTYMKSWCFNSKTIYAYDKSTNKWDEHNIENICGVNYYHSLRATSLYVTPEALEVLWGFLKPYHISLNGEPLDSLEKLHKNYQYFDDWEIRYPKGAVVKASHRNEIKTKIQQAKFNGIEEKWSSLFENNWSGFIREIENVLQLIRTNKQIKLTTKAFSEIMRYFVMFEWRSLNGNIHFKNAFDWIDSVFPLSSVDLNEDERDVLCNKTALDLMKHNLLLKYFDLFQSKKGIIQTYQDHLENNCTFAFLFAPDGTQFITSDNPCFYYTNENREHGSLFVALPNLVIILQKKNPDNPKSYIVHKLSPEEVCDYNKVIFDNASNLVLSNMIFDIDNL